MEIQASGIRHQTLSVHGPASLTPSERRVAKLAVEKRNREIAQVLFVTVKAVEVHLSNVYRKLDIANRSEIATVLKV